MAELKITDKNFNKEVLESDKVVLIDFWAPWCAPCRMMGPVIEQLAAEYDGKAKVGKVNVDEESTDATAATETVSGNEYSYDCFNEERKSY